MRYIVFNVFVLCLCMLCGGGCGSCDGGIGRTLCHFAMVLEGYYCEHKCLPYDPRGADYALYLLCDEGMLAGVNEDDSWYENRRLFDSHEHLLLRKPFDLDAQNGRVTNMRIAYINPPPDILLKENPEFILLVSLPGTSTEGRIVFISSVNVLYVIEGFPPQEDVEKSLLGHEVREIAERWSVSPFDIRLRQPFCLTIGGELWQELSHPDDVSLAMSWKGGCD